MNWSELIGKKIVAFRGLTEKLRDNKWNTPLSFILFDDNETIMEFREQDPYDYHDCSGSARNMNLQKNAPLWHRMFNKEDGFDEPDNLGSFPF